MSPSPEVSLIRDVVVQGVVNDGAALRCFFDVGDDRKLVVIHHDQIGRIARNVTIGRDNGGDRMAHEVDLVLREHAMIGNLQIGQRPAQGTGPTLSATSAPV